LKWTINEPIIYLKVGSFKLYIFEVHPLPNPPHPTPTPRPPREIILTEHPSIYTQSIARAPKSSDNPYYTLSIQEINTNFIKYLNINNLMSNLIRSQAEY
jgi:hypothetical protein